MKRQIFSVFIFPILLGLSQPLIAAGIESIGNFTGQIYGVTYDNEICMGGHIYHMKTDDGDKLGFLYCPDGDEAGQLSDNEALALQRHWHARSHIQVVTDKYGNVISIREI